MTSGLSALSTTFQSALTSPTNNWSGVINSATSQAQQSFDNINNLLLTFIDDMSMVPNSTLESQFVDAISNFGADKEAYFTIAGNVMADCSDAGQSVTSDSTLIS
jgi:hypothetical protein